MATGELYSSRATIQRRAMPSTVSSSQKVCSLPMSGNDMSLTSPTSDTPSGRGIAMSMLMGNGVPEEVLI